MDKMKYILKLKQFVSFITILLLESIVFVACEDKEDSWKRPDDMSSYIPDYSIGTNGSWHVSGNIASFNLEPHVYGDFDYWQLKITSIDYYIDNELVQTDIQGPYSFIYTAIGLGKGKHKLIMKVKIKDLVNGKEIVISPAKEFEVTSDETADSDSSSGFLLQASWSYSGKDVLFTINSVEVSQILADSGWKLKSVSYYLDDKLIGTEAEEPFSFHYTAKDLKRGEHYFIVMAKVANSINGKEAELTSIREIKVGPGINFYIDYNQYIKKGEPLVATPYFLDKRSDAGCEIKSVTYWVDDEKIDTKTTVPFSLSYNLPEDDKVHKMGVSISYSDGTNSPTSYYMTFNDIQFMKSDTHEYVGKLKGNGNLFVGDELECYTKIYRGENITGKDVVKVYLDNKFLGTSSIFPYSCYHQLTISDIGSHSLRFEWTSYDVAGNIKEEKTSYYNGLIVSE